MACGILVPQPGTERGPLAVNVWSPNHWTSRKFLMRVLLFFKLYLFIFGCGGSLVLYRLFSRCGEQGLLFAMALLFQSTGSRARGLQQLQHMGSVVVAPGLQSTGSTVVVHGFSCSTACGIFPDQGLKLCLLHWQADSLPLSHW